MSGFEEPLDAVEEATDPRTLTYAIEAPWRFTNAHRCRSCRAPIGWAENTDTGRKQPFNPDGTSHFSTCPEADTWRTSKPKEAPSGGPAAAVAVVEVARKVSQWHNSIGSGPIEVLDAELGELADAVRAFDQAVGVKR